jgi:hypothetical protein
MDANAQADALLCVLVSCFEGGALHFVGDVGTITNSTFIGNTANEGGAVWCDGHNTITGTNFTSNIALQGRRLPHNTQQTCVIVLAAIATAPTSLQVVSVCDTASCMRC